MVSPPELYLEIWNLVGTLMLNSFNFAIEHGVFHRDQKTSLISLLLKKGKDPLDCSSCAAAERFRLSHVI